MHPLSGLRPLAQTVAPVSFRRSRLCPMRFVNILRVTHEDFIYENPFDTPQGDLGAADHPKDEILNERENAAFFDDLS